MHDINSSTWFLINEKCSTFFNSQISRARYLQFFNKKTHVSLNHIMQFSFILWKYVVGLCTKKSVWCGSNVFSHVFLRSYIYTYPQYDFTWQFYHQDQAQWIVIFGSLIHNVTVRTSWTNIFEFNDCGRRKQCRAFEFWINQTEVIALIATTSHKWNHFDMYNRIY